MNIHHKCQFMFLFFPTNIVPTQISPASVEGAPSPGGSEATLRSLPVTGILSKVNKDYTAGWWFFTNPFEKYATVKMEINLPQVLAKIKLPSESPPLRQWSVYYQPKECTFKGKSWALPRPCKSDHNLNHANDHENFWPTLDVFKSETPFPRGMAN